MPILDLERRVVPPSNKMRISVPPEGEVFVDAVMHRGKKAIEIGGSDSLALEYRDRNGVRAYRVEGSDINSVPITAVATRGGLPITRNFHNFLWVPDQISEEIKSGQVTLEIPQAKQLFTPKEVTVFPADPEEKDKKRKVPIAEIAGIAALGLANVLGVELNNDLLKITSLAADGVALGEMAVSLYLHRSLTHQQVEFTPATEEAFRVILWSTTTAMRRSRFVNGHLWHHKTADTPDDPHSPKHKGFGNVFFRQGSLIKEAEKRGEVPDYWSKRGRKDDWRDKYLYTPITGVPTLFLAHHFIGSKMGLSTEETLASAVAHLAAMKVVFGVVTAGTHKEGEPRNLPKPYDVIDFGLMGEGKHEEHHKRPYDPDFASELEGQMDTGYAVLRFLEAIGQARIKRR